MSEPEARLAAGRTEPPGRDEPGRPAFYAMRSGGWRDWWTLLHPPYTAWHLSYVVFGAAVAPVLDGGRLAATLVAFFLGVGLTAHALDELQGRPLRTRIPNGVLWAVAIAALAIAVALGIVGAARVTFALTETRSTSPRDTDTRTLPNGACRDSSASAASSACAFEPMNCRAPFTTICGVYPDGRPSART